MTLSTSRNDNGQRCGARTAPTGGGGLMLVILLALLSSLETVVAIKYLYYGQYSSGSSCTDSTGAGSVGLEGECTLLVSNGSTSHRIDCSSGSTVLVPYDTTDCSGDVSLTEAGYESDTCLFDSVQFFCADEPTVFLYKTFAPGGDCSGEPESTEITSSSVCIDSLKIVQLTETLVEERQWYSSTCSNDPDIIKNQTLDECFDGTNMISVLQSPTNRPSLSPVTDKPSIAPITPQPSASPITSRPSKTPSRRPSNRPSTRPSGRPSNRPSRRPSARPSTRPSRRPSARPSTRPSRRPSARPSTRPSRRPSTRPSRRPSARPSMRPSRTPTRPRPTTSPTLPQPSASPTTSSPSSASAFFGHSKGIMMAAIAVMVLSLKSLSRSRLIADHTASPISLHSSHSSAHPPVTRLSKSNPPNSASSKRPSSSAHATA